MKRMIIQLLIIFYLQIIHSLPLTSSVENKTIPDIHIQNDDTKQTNDKTIEEIVQHQTDTIKKIVSNQQQQQQSRIDYPVITKYNIEDKQKIKQNIDKLTLEELQIRCQHLSRLSNNNNNKTNTKEIKITTQKPTTTIKPENLFYQQIKIGNKIQSLHYTTQKSPISGFYITTKTTTSKPSSVEIIQQNKLPHNVKYIKLEPVILQKTILNDGRTIYYWHKSLPSSVQYQSPENTLTNTNLDRYDTIHNHNKPFATPTTTTSTTTTSSPSNSYDFRNFFPSFYSIGRSEPSTTTTTEKTTTTTTTTTETPTTEELQYTHQLRFVVPVPYANNDNVMKQPWDFDQFAYYPKPLQPSTVNVQVPYIPTFHVIKALAVPNKYSNDGKIDENNGNIDNVQV